MTRDVTAEELSLRTRLPLTAGTNAAGHLTIGGCDALDLLRRFESPLYVFDELTLREKCREYVREFTTRYPDCGILYAAKAYINLAIAQIVSQEDLGLDVVSGGELAVALAAGFPADRIYFHGNNKSREELRRLCVNFSRTRLSRFLHEKRRPSH